MNGWPEHALAAAGHPDPYPYYRALARDGWRRDEALGLWLAASCQAVDAVLASRPAGCGRRGSLCRRAAPDRCWETCSAAGCG
ncbi:hypothetical protein [Chromobacterium violaceum]|uniref:Uncharacterized protein n=1 Tax=Chromobacterium violaceum TaxID=536 RepID=A0AAX2MFD5_CHRVL|nr:hypothetical protein [Chromobacterium violaceum]SUY93045.1 Uncharacterised protein [Chromobacterium violaceum]